MSVEFGPNMTMAKATEEYKKRIWEGPTDCPCCGRIGKVYERKLGLGVRVALIGFAEMGPNNGWVNAEDMVHVYRRWAKGATEWTNLRYFGLVESLDAVDPSAKEKARMDKGTEGTGMYRITKSGWRFLAGLESIPRVAYVFDDAVLKFSDDHVTWESVKGKKDDKFNWEEILRPALAKIPSGIMDASIETQLSLL